MRTEGAGATGIEIENKRKASIKVGHSSNKMATIATLLGQGTSPAVIRYPRESKRTKRRTAKTNNSSKMDRANHEA